MHLKDKIRILESWVVSTLAYDASTWAPTKTQVRKLKSTQNSMLCSILKVKLQDIIKIKKMKFKYVGHIARGKENWNKIVTEQTPMEYKTKTGRPLTHWQDEIEGGGIALASCSP